MLFFIPQIIICVLLITTIVLQSQGSGLSSTFGGGERVYRSKRNIEKFLIYATVALTALFAIISVLLLLHH